MPSSTATIPMIRSNIDLSEDVRQQVGTMLQKALAASIDLAYQVKQAHWTVRGQNFVGLHKLFDEMFEELTGLIIDEVAERATSIGCMPQGTVRQVARFSDLPEYELETRLGSDHVQVLCERYAQVGEQLRSFADEAEEAGDMATADLFVDAIKIIDKRRWMLEAHFETGERQNNNR